MQKIHLLIIKNKPLLDVLEELKFFYTYNVSFYKSLEKFEKENSTNLAENSIIIFDFQYFQNIKSRTMKTINPKIFLAHKNENLIKLDQLKVKNFEIIFTPFRIDDFISKIKIILSKNKFTKKSFIKIKNYFLDVNKREVSKDQTKLKLTEREVDFLMHLNKKKEPLTIDEILTDVWKYSLGTQTHTVETHVHRLRKKFLQKFNDKIIKNNKDGYYV